MESYSATDLMLPLEMCPTVQKDAPLVQAFDALETAQGNSLSLRYPFQNIIVLDDAGKAVGILDRFDVLKSLEPKYHHFEEASSMSVFGLNPSYVLAMLEEHKLLQQPFNDLCGRAAGMRVTDCMQPVGEGDFIASDASLHVIVHQFIAGCKSILFVLNEGRLVGVLRLTDVFQLVSDSIKVCHLPEE